jgi:DNA polymerase-1
MKLALITGNGQKNAHTVDRYTQATIDACAAAIGIASPEVVYIAALPDAPKGALPIQALRDARPDLLNRIYDAAPDMIVSLGRDPLHALLGEPIALKNEHGRMRWLDVCGVADHSGPGCRRIPWVPTIAPWQVVGRGSSDLHRDFANVLYKALSQSEPLPEMDIELHVCETATDLEDALQVLEGASVVGVDVETTGLSPYRDTMTAVGLGAVYDRDSGVAVIATDKCLEDQASWDLLWDAIWRQTRRSVGHNFKFDMQFLQRIIDWPPEAAWLGDTLLVAHLADERNTGPRSRARGSGLKDLVAQRYDLQYGFDFGKDAEEASAAARDELHVYLGKDVVYTARLFLDLKDEADAETGALMSAHDTLLMPASVALARAESAGAPVDRAWIEALLVKITARVARRRAALEKAIIPLTPTVVVDNVLAPMQVADAMYDEWGMTPDMRRNGRLIENDRSTDKDHKAAAIAKYRIRGGAWYRQAGWLMSLDRLMKDVKLISTYQKAILDRMDDDGRLRASFLLHGTSTGRLSSREPNLQNVPAVDDRELYNGQMRYKLRSGEWVHNPMRRAFRTEPGRQWVEVDYSQLELRVAAGISSDPAFTAVFTGGRDVHREVASSIFSKAPEDITKPERYLAKAVAFGILYGRSAKAIAGGAEMDYAERELHMTRWTEEVAAAFITKFLASYPDLDAWIASVHQTAPVAGFVASPFGRRRRFPYFDTNEAASIRRQAVNTPIQSAASDICLRAFVELQRRVREAGIDAVVMFPVHDSICVDVADSAVAALEILCRSIMEVDFMGVPLKVDFEWGPTWADTEAH